MKCLAIFFILIALSAVVVDSKVHRHAKAHKSHKSHKSHSRHLAKGINTNSPFFQFAAGSISVFSGSESFIDGCLLTMPGWQAVDAAEATSPAGVEKNMSSAQSETWKTVLSFLGDGINVACQYKDQIMGLIRSKAKKFMRRNRRLFLQGKKIKKWSWAGLFNSIVADVKGLWDNVTKVTKKGYNYVIKGIDYVVQKGKVLADFITKTLTDLITPILTALENIRQKVVNWLTASPHMIKYRALVNCLLTVKGVQAIKGLVDAFTSLTSTITALATPAGWVDLLVNLICGWQSLKSAVESLQSAWNATADPKLKFNSYGKALGHMLNAIIAA